MLASFCSENRLERHAKNGQFVAWANRLQAGGGGFLPNHQERLMSHGTRPGPATLLLGELGLGGSNFLKFKCANVCLVLSHGKRQE